MGQNQELTVGSVTLDTPGSSINPTFHEQILEFKDTLSVKTGQPFSEEMLRDAIQTLYERDLFAQVRAFGEMHENIIDLRFELIPTTRISDLKFIGNDSLSDDILTRALRLRKDDTVFPDDLKKEIERLNVLYRRHGFIDAAIQAESRPQHSPYHTTIRYLITEGEPVTINSIRFLGDPYFPKRWLARKLPLRKGDRIDLDTFTKAVKQLRSEYVAEGFAETTIAILDADESDWQTSRLLTKGQLRLSIKAGRRVRVAFHGNEHYSPNELKAAIANEIPEVFTYNYATLERIQKTLTDFYRREGYLHVKVRPQTDLEGKRLKRVFFLIHEGTRTKLTDVTFHETWHFKSKQLKDELFAFVRDRLVEEDEDSLKPPAFEAMRRSIYRIEERANRYPAWEKPTFARPERLDSDEVFIPTVYEDGIRALTQFYRENGFLSTRISRPALKVNETGQRLRVHYTVNEGVQTFIRAINIFGVSTLDERRLAKLLGFRAGQPLNDLAFDAAQRRIRDAYAGEGRIYAEADLSYTLTPDHRLADVMLAVREGPQVRVSGMLVSGLKRTRAETVLRELTFEHGDILTPKDMSASREWVQRLGIFQMVTVKPWKPEKEEAEKKVVVSVSERPPGRFELSGGIATDKGVRFGTLFIYRNLFGSALEFHLRAKVNHRIPALLDDQFASLYDDLSVIDSLEREITVGFYHPSMMGSKIGIRTDLLHLRSQQRAYGLDKNAFILAFDTEYIPYLTLAQINEFAYVDSVTTGFEAIRANEFIPEDGQTWEISPKLQAIFDFRDSVFNPTWGVVISGLGEYFETLLGDKNYDLFRSKGSLTGYIPIPITRQPSVLRLSANIGVINNISSANTPVDKRFKLGGRTSLRGFGEEAIHPADLSDEARQSVYTYDTPSEGGDAFTLLKADFRIPVYKSYYAGAFVDSGSLWIDPDHIDFRLDRYKSSAGGGLHYRTPVGDISLEIGWNLNPDKELHEDNWRFHFSISLF